MSAWEDFSDREKLNWLRARLTKVENQVDALQHLIHEIGEAVKALEKRQPEK
ncbi:hypothetical protein [Pseudolabrys taiwanensis]|uniref:hypothetical protein n=1 Tax=Pseudolabrys taiwanensis TaxID=331696 RepID=UPI0013B40D2D|nr:hypothetical protein [Pseudolabrys taiwanensis]